MKTLLPSLVALLLFLPMIFHAEEASRTWTSSDGKKIEGVILGLEDETIALQTEKGKFEFPLSRLSNDDQAFARNWLKEKMEATLTPGGDSKSAGKTAPPLGNFDNLALGAWPQYVVAELEVDQIEIIEPGKKKEESALDSLKDKEEATDEEEEESDEEIYLYRTPHFEFRSPDRLSASVVREFARIFEATFGFIDQMPIGLAPSPSSNGYYQTKLYMTSNDYYADGGMAGSGGMFSWRRRGNEYSGMIKVPLSNLGVEYTGTRFIVDQNKRSDTLTHEIAHQVMMRWLATPMPTWLSEGIAEVVSSQEYDNGRFKLNSMDRAVVEAVTRGRGREFQMVPLERLMTISHSDWASELAGGQGGINYNSANVLAFYFLKLDGEGDAAHLVEFLKKLTEGGTRGDAVEGIQNELLLRSRSYEKLQEDVASAWRSEGLQISF